MIDFALGNAIDLAQLVSLKAGPPTTFRWATRRPTLTELALAESVTAEECSEARKYLASLNELRDTLVSDTLGRCPLPHEI
jgi:hypothetical protein